MVSRVQISSPIMGEPAPSDNVFVGDLPVDITNDGVNQIFAAYGTIVQCKALPSKRPGHKASALVRFASVEEATWVVSNLNGNLAEGLDEPIQVRFANNSSKSDAGHTSWNSPVTTSWHTTPAAPVPQTSAISSDEPNPSDNVFVGDLPAEITNDQVAEIFGAYGTVVQCRALPPKGGQTKASALVRFGSVEEATWIIDNLNGNLAEGLEEPIICRYANNNGGGSGGGGRIPPVLSSGAAGKGAWNKRSEQYEPYNNGSSWSTTWHDNNNSKGYGKNAILSSETWSLPQPPLPTKGSGKGKACVADSFSSLFLAAKKANLLGPNRVPEECQVYVNNLPPDTTDLSLYKMFSPFGAIAAGGVKAMLNNDGTCKGFGFVDFLDSAGTEQAITAFDGFSAPDGSTIVASTKAPKKTAH